ncbi:type I-E CRISPR-associated protein Cse2/CasB [Nocardiopsis ansamitocini]|uniref:Type I-E CRISPR-associated protein Cse2/CasB n=1 Tax=Nocardiopsis ansamitocini TaxID=1670832 RepID=A0A9W6UHA2_9ACTN|nr:type I-E CRISPR-associated protein Cse2/CasB [Nocardiopsis ansamitocini]GLU48646.1 hypothetical protein Nans01_29970 [Nocardiopsis ansamitocini]
MTTPLADTRYRLSEQTLRDFAKEFTELAAFNASARGDLRTAVRADRTDAVRAQRYLISWMHDELGGLPSPHVQASLYTTAGLIAHFHSAPTLLERYERHLEQEKEKEEKNEEEGGFPAWVPRLDLGLALGEVQRAQEARRSERPSSESAGLSPMEKRLQHLCRCDDERLRRYLFSALSYLNSAGAVLPAWWQLADDLRFRVYQRNKVALYWQQSFIFAPPWRR